MDPHSLFSLNDHLEALSEHGDPLEVLERTVDLSIFGPGWSRVSEGSKGGRPPFDPVAIVQDPDPAGPAQPADARTEFMIRDRLSWMRFLGFSLGDRTPDENTIWMLVLPLLRGYVAPKSRLPDAAAMALMPDAAEGRVTSGWGSVSAKHSPCWGGWKGGCSLLSSIP